MGGRRAYLELIQEEHRRICDAIREGDPKAAREAMRRHLTRSLERYRRLAAERSSGGATLVPERREEQAVRAPAWHVEMG